FEREIEADRALLPRLQGDFLFLKTISVFCVAKMICLPGGELLLLAGADRFTVKREPPAGGRGVDAEKSGVCLQPIIARHLALAVAHLDHILDGRIPLLLDQYLVSPARDLDLGGKVADGCAVEENGRILRRDIKANEALDPLKRQLIRKLLAAHQIIALLKRRIPGMLGADDVASGLKLRGEGGRGRNRHTVNKPVNFLFNIRRGDIELGRQRAERETHFRSLLSGFDHPLKRLKTGRPRLDLRIAREREEGALKIDG